MRMISRREMLQTTACGFGYLALAEMAARSSLAASQATQVPHFSPRAKRVIFLFMQGGPSQVDTFDYKSNLATNDGKVMPFDDARTLAKEKKIIGHRVMKSPWNFRQFGQCGHWVSDLFPHIAKHVDDICFLHGMHTEGIAHGPATLFLHTGSVNLVRPSVGSWVTYGLGTENDSLPGFISICPSMGNGGPRNFGNAFLPTVYQGTPIGRAGIPPEQATIPNLTNPRMTAIEQRSQLDLLARLQAEQLRDHPGDDELEAIARSYDLAYRMQMEAPDVLDLSRETAATQREYGIGEKDTDAFGRQCLLARRLAEAGVRYIQVNYGDNTNNPAWDQHSNLPKHADHAKASDKPVAALLADLKQRGLLEDTLVWWGGEFGRTPYAEKNGTGRDHDPNGFTVWLAGGGTKPGFSFGATDDFGHHAVENRVHMHDLHATVLHLLGLQHDRLTFRWAGRDFRLTDIYGNVVRPIMA